MTQIVTGFVRSVPTEAPIFDDLSKTAVGIDSASWNPNGITHPSNMPIDHPRATRSAGRLSCTIRCFNPLMPFLTRRLIFPNREKSEFEGAAADSVASETDLNEFVWVVWFFMLMATYFTRFNPPWQRAPTRKPGATHLKQHPFLMRG